MRLTINIVAVVMLTLGMAGLAAQAKPNFAGKWTMVPAPNAAEIMGLGTAFTAAQDDKTLTVTPTNHQVLGRQSPEQLKAVYNLDGSSSRNPLNRNGDSIDRSSKVRWDDSKLVIMTTTTSDGNSNDQIQTWSLDPSGNLIVEATLTYRGNSKTTKATYKRD